MEETTPVGDKIDYAHDDHDASANPNKPLIGKLDQMPTSNRDRQANYGKNIDPDERLHDCVEPTGCISRIQRYREPHEIRNVNRHKSDEERQGKSNSRVLPNWNRFGQPPLESVALHIGIEL